MNPPRLLIAGVGNLFLGDDAFGCVMTARLAARAWPATVSVRDFGIRSRDLAEALAECEMAIIVDIIGRGGPPGTVYCLEPSTDAAPPPADGHTLTLDSVLRALPPGGGPRILRVVGCEPATFETDPDGALSPAVLSAADQAEELIVDLAARLLAPREGPCHA